MRMRLVWLAGLAVGVALLFTPGALGDDVSIQPWGNATDSAISDFVQSPYAARQWGGDGASAENLYNLIHDGYNASQVDYLETALEAAGQAAKTYPNPWAVVGAVAISTVGAYLAYNAQGRWFHWLSSQWGSAISGQTNGCTAAATALTSNCQLWRIKDRRSERRLLSGRATRGFAFRPRRNGGGLRGVERG